MNRLSKSLLVGLLEQENYITGFYGGGFKPPTKGHFAVVKKSLEQFPDIDKFYIIIGKGIRDGISQDESYSVWNIYKKYLGDKVEIVKADSSPLKYVKDYIKENTDHKSLVFIGSRDDNDEDAQDFVKRKEFFDKYGDNVEVKNITTTGGVSGTKAREAAKISKEQFFQFIPKELTDEEKNLIFTYVQTVIQENAIKKVASRAKELSKNFTKAFKDQKGDFKGFGSLVIKYLRKEDLTPEEKEKLKQNFTDILKTSGVAITFPILGASGNVLLGWLTNKLTKGKFTTLPSKFKNQLLDHQIIETLSGINLSQSLNENASYSKDINIKEKILELTKHMLAKGMNIQPLPKVKFINGDNENAREFLGKTAYYNPETQTIILYTEGRHPKDIVRSFSHEMIHHIQNLEDRLGDVLTTNTMEDDNIDKLEQEANLKGTMTFRNWTDSLNESKQVGVIYHYTTFENGLKILQSNELKGGAAEDSTNANPVFAISFTRDKRFHNNHNVGFDVSSFGQRPQVRFTVDGNKLSNRYKIQPYAQIGGSGRFEKQREEFEAEERVVSNKPFSIPILSYIESVDILIEYKKPGNDDWDMEWDYKTYAPISAELVKFAQDKNLPINLIVNKNGDPWPDKAKKTILQKILNWFSINEANLKGTMTFRNWTDSLNESFYLDIPKFSQPKTLQHYLIENINEISLSKENAVDVNGDLTGGTFTVGDITYEYNIKNIPNPYKNLGLFYNVQFTPRGEVTSIPKGGKENYIKILSTMYKIIVDFIEKEKPEYIGISSLDNSGDKNYHTVYNRLTTNNLNLIPGYFRKDSNLTFDSPQGKGRFIVLKKKDSLDEKKSKDPFGLNQYARELAQELEETLIVEGRYDKLANQISNILFRLFKDTHDKGNKDGKFELTVGPDDEDIHSDQFEFDLEGIVEITDDEYFVDGGANEGFDDRGNEITPLLSVKFKIPKNPKWSTISMDLKDVVRHELEHLTQGGENERPGKYMEDDQLLRDLIDADVLPKSQYFKLEKEVDAMLQGLYFKAKKSRLPFKKVIDDYLDKVGLTPQEKEEILDFWRRRRKALSLPIFENEEKVRDYKIFLDMDGVLVDFDEQFKELTGQYPKDYEATHTIEEFWDEIDNAGVGFWRGMKWMPGGEALYNRTSQFDHVLLSSPSRSEVSKIGKHLWRRDKTPNTKLILSRSHLKKNYAAPNHILIDDRESNIKQWRDAGGIGILYKSAEQVNKELDKLSL
jgi:hypothetical protein